MHLEWSLIVGSLINFAILFWLLKKFLYKPVCGMLDKRHDKVMSDVKAAEDAKTEAEKLRDEYAAQMKDAKNEAQEIINNATKIGEQTKANIVNEAREEAAKVSQKAQEEIRQEKAQAINELRNEVAGLAVLAAEKIVGKSIDVKDHETMINNFVNEVGDAK